MMQAIAMNYKVFCFFIPMDHKTTKGAKFRKENYPLKYFKLVKLIIVARVGNVVHGPLLQFSQRSTVLIQTFTIADLSV